MDAIKKKEYQKNIVFIQNLAKNGPKKKTLKKYFSLSDIKKRKKTLKKLIKIGSDLENKKNMKPNLTLKILGDIKKLSDFQIKKNLINFKGAYFYDLYINNTQKDNKKTTISNLVNIIKRVGKEELNRVKKTREIKTKKEIETKIQNIINDHYERKKTIKKKKKYKQQQQQYFKKKIKYLYKEFKELKNTEINIEGDSCITPIGKLGLLPKEISNLLDDNEFQYFRYGSIGDGDCLFHSFLEATNKKYYQLDGSILGEYFQKQKLTRSLRKYMAKNVNEHFMEYFSINGLFNKESYIQHLLNIGEYGENDDITFFSALKNVNIFMFQSGIDINNISISPIAINNFHFDIELPSIFVYNMNQHHYEPIIRLSKSDLQKPNFNKKNLNNNILLPGNNSKVLKIAQKYFNSYSNTSKLLRNWNITPKKYYQKILDSINKLKTECEMERKKDQYSIKYKQLKSVLTQELKKEMSIKKYSNCYKNSKDLKHPDRLGFCNKGKYLFTIPYSQDTCCSINKETPVAYNSKQKVLKETLLSTHKKIKNIDIKKILSKNKEITLEKIYPKIKEFCVSSELEVDEKEIKEIISKNLRKKNIKKMQIEKVVEHIIEKIIDYLMKNKSNKNKLKKKNNIISFFKTLSEFDRRNIADEDSGGGFTKELMDLDTSNGKKQVEVLIGKTIKILENDETGEIKMISGIDVRSLYYNIIDEDGDDDWTRIGLIFYNNDIMDSIEITEKKII